MIEKLGNVFYRVPDMDAAVTFYSQVLGLPLKFRDGNNWAAFDVHPPGESKQCTVRWQAQSRTLRDSCGGRTFPADGTGLTRYRASVDKKGELVVDLRRPLT